MTIGQPPLRVCGRQITKTLSFVACVYQVGEEAMFAELPTDRKAIWLQSNAAALMRKRKHDELVIIS